MKHPITTFLTLAAALVPLLSGPALGGITSGSPSGPDTGSLMKRKPHVASASSALRPSRLRLEARLVGRPGTRYALGVGPYVLAEGTLSATGRSRVELILPALLAEALANGAPAWAAPASGNDAPLALRVLAVAR